MSKPTVKEAIDVVINCCAVGCGTKDKCCWLETLIDSAQEAERLREENEALKKVIFNRGICKSMAEVRRIAHSALGGNQK